MKIFFVLFLFLKLLNAQSLFNKDQKLIYASQLPYPDFVTVLEDMGEFGVKIKSGKYNITSIVKRNKLHVIQEINSVKVYNNAGKYLTYQTGDYYFTRYDNSFGAIKIIKAYSPNFVSIKSGSSTTLIDPSVDTFKNVLLKASYKNVDNNFKIGTLVSAEIDREIETTDNIEFFVSTNTTTLVKLKDSKILYPLSSLLIESNFAKISYATITLKNNSSAKINPGVKVLIDYGRDEYCTGIVGQLISNKQKTFFKFQKDSSTCGGEYT
jgi:hypothetical protein